MQCPRCGRENPPENEYCGRCGYEMAQAEGAPSDGDLVPCAKHPREMTALRCGKCDTPVCPKCVVLSPAGTRCRECSRVHVPLRPETVVRSTGLQLRRLFSGGIQQWWILLALLSLGGMLIRSCASMVRGPAHPRVERAVQEERSE